MGVPTPIPGIGIVPITQDGKLAHPTFVRMWQQQTNLQQAQINALSAGLSALQNATTQAQAAAASANAAAALADGGGSVTARSGSQTIDNLFVASASDWTSGPQVDLLTVSAGTFTASVSFLNFYFGAVRLSGTGYYRIVEIVGAAESIVFNGTITISFIADVIDTGGGGGVPPVVFDTVLGDDNIADLAAMNLASTSTGSVSYRLDFLLPGPFNMQAVYLFVRRS